MAFSGPDINGVITQSGTDANLSGLSSIVGVTITDDDPTNGKKTYDMGDLRLNITGTLSHNPDRELMIFHHEKSSGSSSVSEPVLVIAAAATYNYGIKTTTSDGKIGYSSGCGLMFTGRPYSNWHPSDNAITMNSANSKFVCRGGIIESSRGLFFNGNIDVEETVFLNANNRSSMEIRTFGNGSITTDRAQNIVLAGGISILDPYFMSEQKIIFRNGAIARTYGGYFEVELLDFDVSKNVFNYDIGNCANVTQLIQDYHVVNSANGSNVRAMWRDTTGNFNQLGNTFIHKEVSFSIKDTNLTPIQNVKVYLQDNPSPYAKSISVNTTHATLIYPTPTLATAVVSNGGKTISYDYTVAIEYNKITDVNGNIPKFKVLTATQFLEKQTSDASATQYYVTFSGGVWREADGQVPTYSDWDTNRFGNFYKVDRRSNSNSSLDDFTFKFLGYNHLLSKATYPLKGIGELQIEWLLFDDNTIIENDKSIVDAYTQLESPQKFYDRAKSYLYDNFAGEEELIVTRDGNVIDAGSYNVFLDKTAVDTFAFDGSNITIKCDNFIGQIQTTGSFTLLNGALYNSVPSYLDLTLQDGYISIYDNVGDLKYYTNQDQIISLPLDSTGTWTYKYAKYGFRIGEGSFVVNGTTIDISPKYTPDIYVTDVVTNVSAFTTLNDIQEIYNYLSYYSTTSAAMEYSEYYLYGNTLNLLTNTLVIDSNATEVFDYDGSLFTIKSDKMTSTLLFDTIQASNVYLSGNSIVEDIEIDAAHLYNTNVVDLSGLTLKGTLVYNTDSAYSIFYTDCTIDKVINDGTGLINITRINSIIYDISDNEITTSVPISINITLPTDAYIAIYKPNGDRLYYGSGNQTLILGGGDTVTGTWSYTVAKYGHVKSVGTFTMDKDISSVTDISIASLNIDPLVSETDVSITSSYTDINSTSKIYDYISYFLTTSDGIIYNNNGGSIASRSIGSFSFDKDLTLDSNATQILQVIGNVFTIKSSGLNEDVTMYINGDFNTLNSTALGSDVKVRANNLDSELEFKSIDEITFFPTANDRNNGTNAGDFLINPTIYRFKYGSIYSGVTFSGTVFYRVSVAGSVILGSTTIIQYGNILDLGTYGQLQQIINSQDIINEGVKKASRLIPHSENI